MPILCVLGNIWKINLFNEKLALKSCHFLLLRALEALKRYLWGEQKWRKGCIPCFSHFYYLFMSSKANGRGKKRKEPYRLGNHYDMPALTTPTTLKKIYSLEVLSLNISSSHLFLLLKNVSHRNPRIGQATKSWRNIQMEISAFFSSCYSFFTRQ